MNGTELLPGWSQAAGKSAVLDFVESVSRPSASYVPPAERIATFDNDGRLWCEKPQYVEAASSSAAGSRWSKPTRPRHESSRTRRSWRTTRPGSRTCSTTFRTWSRASPRLRRDDLVDFVLGIITGIAVLATDRLPAMILGITYLIYRVSFPGRVELGRGEKQGLRGPALVLWNQTGRGQPTAWEVSEVMLYRFDAPLVFSNAGAFKASGQQILIDTAARGPLPSMLVIDFEEVYTDSSGAESIRGLKRYTSRYDVEILIARLHADPGRHWRETACWRRSGRTTSTTVCRLLSRRATGRRSNRISRRSKRTKRTKGPGR